MNALRIARLLRERLQCLRCVDCASFQRDAMELVSRFIEFAKAHNAGCAFAGVPPDRHPSITSLVMQVGLTFTPK